MKRIVFLSIAILMVSLMVVGCGKKQAPPEETISTTTLMIYMVGSDLEPKSGAASADLQEIAQSGIDLSRNKVVVCAGGSPNWHNEQVDAQQINVLTLGEQGFSSVSTLPNASMGTAEQLRSFLDYCYQNYPNDSFALILWDHGNGPVMGYGKDILYGNDALLLSEIGQAMASSVFSKENKLSWVGFDACLMASAELSCLLSDYANYLVASQEIEPAFGWDYSFLSQLGLVDTPQLLQGITDKYMAACDAYYKGRGYEHYDVTLSVVDLSCAAELDSAINALFSAASGEVSHYYDLLAMNRVQSRALGRATTGSEYDLVDLRDMAVQLSAQYPALTKALTDVIDRMVIVNATSIEGCCGMSLYYPFFNKYYYEKDWKTVYSQLNLFPAYQTYLAGFEQTWLQENKLEQQTLSATPEQTAKNTYSVTLPDQQAKSFASAVYYIMERESGDIYRPVFISRDVTWENNTLTAQYDGMAIYIRTKRGTTFIPPLSAVDQIDRLYRYSGEFRLANGTYKPQDLSDEELPEESRSDWRYLLTLNSETGNVEMSGTVPYADTTTQDLVEYGRIAEADLSIYGTLIFFQEQSRYITRYPNGVILPLDQWYSTEITSYYSLPLADGYTFHYEPLTGSEYYLMFEITDTQSGVYCSELLPISVETVKQEEDPLPVTTAKWAPGEHRVLLKQQDGVSIYLTTKDTEDDGTRYFVEAENANDYAVQIWMTDGVMNESLSTGSGAYFTVDPYDFMYEELSFGIAEDLGYLENLTSLYFDVEVTKDRSGALLWPPQQLQVDMTSAPSADCSPSYQHRTDYDTPCMSAMAEKQVIYASKDLRVTLVGFGKASQFAYSNTDVYVYAENLSDEKITFGLCGLVVNGCFISCYDSKTLPPGMQTYRSASFPTDDLEDLGIQQIHSLSLMIAVSDGDRLWWSNKTNCIWCPVTLSQSGKLQTVKTGTLLWEENNVRVFLEKTSPKLGHWQVVIENMSDVDISLETMDVSFDGEASHPRYWLYLDDGKLGAGQCCVSEFNISGFDDAIELPKEVAFRFQVRSFDETQILFTATQPVTLSIK